MIPAVLAWLGLAGCIPAARPPAAVLSDFRRVDSGDLSVTIDHVTGTFVVDPQPAGYEQFHLVAAATGRHWAVRCELAPDHAHGDASEGTDLACRTMEGSSEPPFGLTLRDACATGTVYVREAPLPLVALRRDGYAIIGASGDELARVDLTAGDVRYWIRDGADADTEIAVAFAAVALNRHAAVAPWSRRCAVQPS